MTYPSSEGEFKITLMDRQMGVGGSKISSADEKKSDKISEGGGDKISTLLVLSYIS
jgi:hypothetical protein